MPTDSTLYAPPARHSTLVAWLILAAIIGVELAIQFGGGRPGAAEHVRAEALRDWGFVATRFRGWLAGGSGHGVGRAFVTYAFLHAGPLHLAAAGGLYLASATFLARHIGGLRLVALFLVAAVGGALAFGLTAETRAPMVGAVPAAFGMLGAVKAWEFRHIKRAGASWGRYGVSLACLAGLLVLAHLYGRAIMPNAANLGGLAAGVLVAPILARQPPHGRFFL